MKNIKVKWTGSYPCLCVGKWIIEVDGVDFSDCIPNIKKQAPMDTYGEYEDWHFADDWEEVWDSYKEGLQYEDWILKNHYWVDKIVTSNEDQERLFRAIQAEDWRHCSCGGCI